MLIGSTIGANDYGASLGHGPRGEAGQLQDGQGQLIYNFLSTTRNPDQASGSAVVQRQQSLVQTTPNLARMTTGLTRREAIGLISQTSNELLLWIQTHQRPWHMVTLLPEAKKVFRSIASLDLAYKIGIIATTATTMLFKAKFEADLLFSDKFTWSDTKMIWVTPEYVSDHVTSTNWYDRDLTDLPDEFEATRARPSGISTDVSRRTSGQAITNIIESVHYQEPLQAIQLILGTMPNATRADADDLVALILKTTMTTATEALTHGWRTDTPVGTRVQLIEATFSRHLKALNMK
jgi:hypothetical protein